ncbi:MAG: FHA domain-containing protein [Eubacterium sp.]|nr:FHA domain-containing protein [Eubacterium sp.]
MFTKDRLTIGKSKVNADYSIENNSAISRTHCEIVRENGVSYLRDLSSTNGTFIDGKKMTPGEKVLLRNGAVIRLGDEDFVFHLRKED